MQYQNRTFSTTTGGRDPEVCYANGGHGEPDTRGRCFLCGTLLPDPNQPLRTIQDPHGRVGADVTIRQRIGGHLYARWANGREDQYPVGFSIDMVDAEVRKQLAARNDTPQGASNG